jgi:hypothetical protein
MVSRYAHDGCTDLLHRRVMTGGQRICDPIPYANKWCKDHRFPAKRMTLLRHPLVKE